MKGTVCRNYIIFVTVGMEIPLVVKDPFDKSPLVKGFSHWSGVPLDLRPSVVKFSN
jgi:hypothetical protein